MNSLKQLLANATSSIVMIIFVIGYFGNFPIALIWGDKRDVVISLFVPFYGTWILIRELLMS